MLDPSPHNFKTLKQDYCAEGNVCIHLSVFLGRLTLMFAIAMIALSVKGDESRFDQANGLFEQGEYEAAIVEYNSLIESGIQTPAVHFNMGNAYFRQNKTGMAIYHYLMAQTLDPLDADVQANLKFKRYGGLTFRRHLFCLASMDTHPSTEHLVHSDIITLLGILRFKNRSTIDGFSKMGGGEIHIGVDDRP